jgi:hypothetical protein
VIAQMFVREGALIVKATHPRLCLASHHLKLLTNPGLTGGEDWGESPPWREHGSLACRRSQSSLISRVGVVPAYGAACVR